MNKFDIENIKNELTKRKAANYEWKLDGEMTQDDIVSKSAKELNDLLKDYDNSKKINAEVKIKK